MSRLVDDMLMLASADNSSWSVQKEETDLETLLLDAAEWFEPAAAEKQIRISVSLPEETLPRCRCDQQRIRQVLSILVDNAVSYAGEGGRVVLTGEYLVEMDIARQVEIPVFDRTGQGEKALREGGY